MSESRDSYLKRSHGMSDEDYETQLIVQGYVCAVCKRVNPSKNGNEPQWLDVDHNHRTDANRGLLCRRCNLVLGMFEDSQELLFRLQEYLRHWDGSEMRYPKFPSESFPAESSSLYEQTAPCVESGG